MIRTSVVLLLVLSGILLFACSTTTGTDTTQSLDQPDNFISVDLNTNLVPAPYVIDTSPTGQFGLDGTTWYIDGTNGSDSNPGTSESQAFWSVQKGVDSSGPGDKIYVMDGTYRYSKSGILHSMAVFLNHSGTASHWILLAACPGNHPRIEYTQGGPIFIGASSYIIVSGFTIQGPANTITLADARARQNSTSDPRYNDAGIQVIGDWNKPTNTTHSHHVIIANNVVYYCSQSGIATGWSDYVTIRSNIVAYNAFWSPVGGSGISLWAQWDSNPSDSGVRNQISENLCFGNDNQVPNIADTVTPKRISDGNGIIIDCFNLYGYTGKTLVENNICFNNGARGINVTRSDHLIIRNNTSYYNMFHSDGMCGDFGIFDNDDVGDPPVHDTTVSNNVVFSRNAIRNSISACSVLYGDNIAGLSFAHNLFNGGGFVLRINGQWTPWDERGGTDLINVDPLFTSASTDPATADFSLRAGSRALDACSDGPAIDFLGNPRPAGAAVDMGALERQ